MSVTRTNCSRVDRHGDAAGIALLAVLIALSLLLLLALPFAISMNIGADAAVHEVLGRKAEQTSASVRDLLLAEAAIGHATYDATRTFDEATEYPAQVTLPEPFAPLRQDDRAQLGGEVFDLQRFVHLDGISPLLLCNLLGTTARLREELKPDDTVIAIDDGANLPEQGFVWIDHELIRYAEKQGSSLGGLSRGLLQDHGYLKPSDHQVAEATLVLDYRCVTAAAWAFDGRTGGTRRDRKPLRSVGDLVEVVTAGFGGFAVEEMDVFARTLTADSASPQAPVWGRPERIFADLQPEPPSRTLRVKSALHLGAGATVRLRNLRSGAIEYGLVMSTSTPRGVAEIMLPSMFELHLLTPVTQPFPAIDTVVEPLLPVPVNANTASAEVLAALCSQVRKGADVRVHEADGQRRVRPPLPVTKAQARELAEQIVATRSKDADGPEVKPLAGFQELAEGIWKARLDAAQGFPQKEVWLYLYRNWLSGRDSAVDMGTAPITFASGPWVGYRAAAQLQRSVVAPGVAARHERNGIAIALPGLPLERSLDTQELLDEAFRIDQRSPYWLTGPVNTGAMGAGEAGNDPGSRYFAHLVAWAFPTADLGQARFPSRDTTEAVIFPAPSAVLPRPWGRLSGLLGEPEVVSHDSFATAIDARGHDVAREGAYRVPNTGPRDRAAVQKRETGHRASLPFSTAGGGSGKWAASFWAEPENLGPSTLLDYSQADKERNAIRLRVADGNLVYEVWDEAGLDPAPSQSPAGVPRTVSEWTLPLAELNLPYLAPVHFAASAFGSRPSELSLAVDGMARGKPKYLTWLAATIPPLDPNIQRPNQGRPGEPIRYELDIQVESTEHFPPVGVLRIGTELFEYTSIAGNAFRCVFRDSSGGRGMRQRAREFRPDIPVDQNGKPTIDINALQSGVLDVFPEHKVGSAVELYGYSALVSQDRFLLPGETRLADPVGGFAVARGWVRNPQPIALQIPNGPSLPIGNGLMDDTQSVDIELADPIPDPLNSNVQYPPAAQAAITDAFSPSGGYALLVQMGFEFNSNVPGNVSAPIVLSGGIEVIKYSSRQGGKLTGVQRGVRLPGDDSLISSQWYDGQPKKFVTQWSVYLVGRPPLDFDWIPVCILWVVPISLPVQDTQALVDPEKTGTSEWFQLYPKGGDVNDTEWVRYDLIQDGRHTLRSNRAAWDRVRWALTNQTQRSRIDVGPLGAQNGPPLTSEGVWGEVQATSGYIGYVPQLESDFPQILRAREALGFRGDAATRTSSHAHQNSTVLPCHRFQLWWGNYGALTGRGGRHDRIALIQGSIASGTERPGVEWHTVNWKMQRFEADNLQRNQRLTERLGEYPFQLVAFQERVAGAFIGPASDQPVDDPRWIDRMVKFPSGELPAAYCDEVYIGAAVGDGERMNGIVDEVDLHTHPLPDLIVDEAFDESQKQIRINPGATYNAVGPRFYAEDLGARFPPGGGLLQVDGEILAYASYRAGVFELATDGRGLLNTEARGHDRGARVHFLTHRPAAILVAAVQPRSDRLQIQALGSMPGRGTALLGRELLHWTWVRTGGDAVTLEMPRHFPEGDGGEDTAPRGLFRARYGTTGQAASSGSPVIAFPFRHWDRHVPEADDPEQSYFQATIREGPVFFKTITWREEKTDVRVGVECLVRADGLVPYSADPVQSRGLWLLQRSGGEDQPLPIGFQASQLEARFAMVYRPGCCDLVGFRTHAWKTAPRVKQVRVEYEGEGRILAERVVLR